jgi:hypothetical protein
MSMFWWVLSWEMCCGSTWNWDLKYVFILCNRIYISSVLLTIGFRYELAKGVNMCGRTPFNRSLWGREWRCSYAQLFTKRTKWVLIRGLNLPYGFGWERGSVTVVLTANHSWRQDPIDRSDWKVGNSRHSTATLSSRPAAGCLHRRVDLSNWFIHSTNHGQTCVIRYLIDCSIIGPNQAYRKLNIRLDVLLTLLVLGRAKLLPCFLPTHDCSNQ